MELVSEQKVNAPRQQVYEALNDPEILRQCIPGCESLEQESETEMAASVVLKVGPVKAKFKGRVELSNLQPPEGYSITGKGSGGAAGFAKGGADIKLLEDGAGTILQYSVKADVGGRLAQLGARLLDSTAKTLAGQFFEKFCELVETGVAEPAAVEEAAAKPAEPEKPAMEKRWVWIAAAAVAIAALAAVIFFSG